MAAIMAARRSQLREAQRTAERWNRKRLIGTFVRYWPGQRDGEGLVSRTTGRAFVLPDGRAVVALQGFDGFIKLTHVEPLTDQVVAPSLEVL